MHEGRAAGNDEVVGTTSEEAVKPGTVHSRSAFLRRTGAGIALSGITLAGAETAAAATTGAASGSRSGRRAVNPKYKKKTIGVAILTASDENILAIAQWAKQASVDAGLNWKWIVTDTQGDPAKPGTAMDSFITQKVDGMMLISVGAGGVESQLAKGKSAGIPTVGCYTFAPLDSSIANDFTLPPDVDAALLGNYLVNDQLKRRKSGTIKVAMLDFAPNVIAARRRAFKGIISANSRFKIVSENYNISLTSTAQSSSAAAQAVIRAHPDLAAIWCNYPPIAVPAANGVQQTGKDVQVYGHIANSAGVDALRDKKNPLVATSWVDWPFLGYSLVDQLLAAFSGAKLDRQAPVLSPEPAVVFDSTNVAREVPKGKKAANWQFGGGTYRKQFVDSWNKRYA